MYGQEKKPRMYHWPQNMCKVKPLKKLISSFELYMLKGQWYMRGFTVPSGDERWYVGLIIECDGNNNKEMVV